MASHPASATDLEGRVRELLLQGDADSAAIAALEALGPGVLGYLSTMLPEDDAHDAFSNFQQGVWRGLQGFRWECSLRAWVYRVAWHAAVRFTRDGYRRRREPLPSHIASKLAASAASLSGIGGRREQLAMLRDELTPEERTLLTLRVGRELDWNEVSAVLATEGEEVSSAALRKRFERLKEKLVVLARERGLLETT